MLAAGRAAPGDTVPVSMPVSTRGEDDLRVLVGDVLARRGLAPSFW